MPLDLWTITDIGCAFLNIICFQVIGSATPEVIVGTTNADGTINLNQRYKLDYCVITVIIMSWLRFFTYFLVVGRISRLLMTLLRMVYDCIAFMFIFCSYILIAATIFTTLFQSVDSSEYGSLSLSLETLFSSFIGNYDYITAPSNIISGSICIMLHKFISSILLLNFIIAILSAVYDYM